MQFPYVQKRGQFKPNSRGSSSERKCPSGSNEKLKNVSRSSKESLRSSSDRSKRSSANSAKTMTRTQLESDINNLTNRLVNKDKEVDYLKKKLEEIRRSSISSSKCRGCGDCKSNSELDEIHEVIEQLDRVRRQLNINAMHIKEPKKIEKTTTPKLDSDKKDLECLNHLLTRCQRLRDILKSSKEMLKNIFLEIDSYKNECDFENPDFVLPDHERYTCFQRKPEKFDEEYKNPSQYFKYERNINFRR